jgi:hypothetical protein
MHTSDGWAKLHRRYAALSELQLAKLQKAGMLPAEPAP